MSDSESHSDAQSLSDADSVADYLEGFKSARMSFEPLDDWLFNHSGDSFNHSGDSCSYRQKLPFDDKPSTVLVHAEAYSCDSSSDVDNKDEECEDSSFEKTVNTDPETDVDNSVDDNNSITADDGNMPVDVSVAKVEIFGGCESLKNKYGSDYIHHFDGDTDVSSNEETDIVASPAVTSCISNQHILEISQPASSKCHYSRSKTSYIGGISPKWESECSGSDLGSAVDSSFFPSLCASIDSSNVSESQNYEDLCISEAVSSVSSHHHVSKPLQYKYVNCQRPSDTEGLNAVAIKKQRSDCFVQEDECENLYHEELSESVSETGQEDRENLYHEGLSESVSETGQEQTETAEAKCERMRLRITQEIFETEATYHRHLELIVELFEDPLRESEMIEDQLISNIFGDIRQIIGVNNELMKRLQTMKVGSAFLLLGPFLKLYSTYANNHEKALAALMDCDQKYPNFGQFRRQQEQLPEMNGLKLNALLITPVQRIPRYRLLLSELLKNTPSDDPDYYALAEAVDQISLVANHINDHIKQQDNFMRMLAIQRSFACPIGPQILVPGRVFIKEGLLKKVSKRGSFFRSNERTFFLFSDVLMYAKSRLLESATSGRAAKSWNGSGRNFTLSPSLICCCIMPLHHCRVEHVLGRARNTDEHGALFTVTCKQESLMLFSDHKTVNSWTSALSKAISECKLNRQSLRKTSSAKQPLRRSGITRLWKAEKRASPFKVGSPNKSGLKTANRNGLVSPVMPGSPRGMLSRLMHPSSKSDQSVSTALQKKHFAVSLQCFNPKTD